MSNKEAAGRRRDRGLWWDRTSYRACLCQARSPRGAAGAGSGGTGGGCSRSAVTGRAGLRHPDRRGRPPTGRGGGRRGRAALRRDRRVGQRCDGYRIRGVQRDRAGGVQARHRGHVSRRRVRDDGRTQANEAAQPRHDRPGRFGAVLPGDSPPGRLLRGEVRDPRLHRLDPHRVAARQEQGAGSQWSNCPG